MSSIVSKNDLNATTEKWFEYAVKVYPYHTDYGGTVWHGTYLTWLEAARVEYLQSMGVNYADLVLQGCELPVVELSLRYHRAVNLGEEIIVKTRLKELTGVRMNWDYRIESADGQQLYLTAKVTLVALDREKGKIMRQLPGTVKDILVKLV
jgi:acyl-CoA thioester hydrolase